RQGKAIDQPVVAAFHRFFLDSVRRAGGRLPEMALMRRFTLYKLRRRPQIGELRKMPSLAGASSNAAGYVYPSPRPSRGGMRSKKALRARGLKALMKVSYYPGCSLEGTASD